MKSEVIMPSDVIMSSPPLFTELDSVALASSQDDQRALQIALELSNLGLLGNCEDDSSTSSYDEITKGKKSQNMTECVPVPSSEHVAEIVGRQGCKIKALRAKTNTYIKTPVRGEEPVFVVTGRKEDVAMARREVQSAAEHFTQIRASRNKAQQQPVLTSVVLPNGESAAGTITLQVRVPYRVVGLVVGPKGATIKRIQQMTHTYIVTPSRDKEPVFEVTGLPENVEKAKEEIDAHIAARTGAQQISIDDDFRNNGTEVGSPLVTSQPASTTTPSILPTTKEPATNSTSAFVPYDSLLRTQSTPSRLLSTSPTTQLPTQPPASLLSSQPGLRTQAPSFFPSTASRLPSPPQQPDFLPLKSIAQPRTTKLNQAGCFPPRRLIGFPATTDVISPDQPCPLLPPPFNTIDTSIPPPPFKFAPPPPPPPGSVSSPTSSFCSTLRLSPTFSDPDLPLLPPALMPIPPPINQSQQHTNDELGSLLRRVKSSEFDVSSFAPTSKFVKSSTPAQNIESGYSSGTTDSLTSGSPVESFGPPGCLSPGFLLDCPVPTPGVAPHCCILCNEMSVEAALVPCGHNLFCYHCANKVVAQQPSVCPMCSQSASMALRIKNQ